MTKTIVTTPPGKAVYPKISDPDTQGQYATGKYKTYIELAPKDLAALKAQVEAFAKAEGLGKGTKRPFKILKKLNNLEVVSATSKFRPLVFDAKKQEIPEDSKLKIGGGSTIRAVLEFFNYDKGISLRLKKVQVIDLVTYGGADEFDVEDGFESQEDDDTDSNADEFEDEDIGI